MPPQKTPKVIARLDTANPDKVKECLASLKEQGYTNLKVIKKPLRFKDGSTKMHIDITTS